ncbi:MAG: PQQ-binding-like beta-propeller repeat protein [Cytophagaceae bacterium]|nr:PQQ-binding-like beta-propeller repeat protein [Cytophagaceae bacterium]
MKHLLLMLVVIGLTVSCTNSPRGSASGIMDWHLFRGDAELSGYTGNRLPENPALLWSYTSGARTVSSPVINNGITYWCDKRGYVRGVDITGSLCFEYDMRTAVEATPMIYDSTLCIGRIDGFMTAISLPRRDTVWTYETMGQISASPNSVSFDERQTIVFGSYDNFLYCVDAQTGKEIKRFESGYYLNGTVSLWGKHVLFGGCDAWLRVINCKTGITTDSLELEAYIPASPAVAGDYCYVGDYSGNIYELLLSEGKIIHHKKIMEANDESDSFVSVPAVTTDAVYFLANNRYLYSLNRKTGTVNWKQMLKGNVGESSPVVCRNKIIVCTKSGIISIHDANSGNQVWEYDAGEQIVGSPAVIKNHFMILTEKGTLLCFGEKND